MRLASPPEPVPSSAEETIWTALKSQRPDQRLLPLDLALLHNPALAQSFYAYNGALHTTTTLPLALLSLAIVRVAVLLENPYAWNVHSIIALKRGLSTDALGRLRSLNAEDVRGPQERIQGLDGTQIAVLRYVDEITLNIRVNQEIFSGLKAHLNDRQILELTFAIGEYNSVNRVLLALEIGHETDENRRWNSVEESFAKA